MRRQRHFPEIQAEPRVNAQIHPTGHYVQFGCGHSAPDGWLNFDASPTLRFERLPLVGRLYTRNSSRFPADVQYGDVLKRLPLPDRSCAGVYASHVLEHHALEDFHRALDETRHLLAPGGRFRLVVPDLAALCGRYVEAVDRQDPEASHRFMTESYLGKATRKRGAKGALLSAFGNSEHLWMWDEFSLNSALEEHGFAKVRRADFGDSDDPAFKAVEDEGRFFGACAMEAVAP